ncbi:hypothetical protein HZS_7074 [Henneguya salminicola]|nr:hypothetical protein HZS_7074 [Henneguya salminicola]
MICGPDKIGKTDLNPSVSLATSSKAQMNTKYIIMELVDNSSEAILLEVIKRRIDKETRIIRDEWKTYNILSGLATSTMRTLSILTTSKHTARWKRLDLIPVSTSCEKRMLLIKV